MATAARRLAKADQFLRRARTARPQSLMRRRFAIPAGAGRNQQLSPPMTVATPAGRRPDSAMSSHYTSRAAFRPLTTARCRSIILHYAHRQPPNCLRVLPPVLFLRLPSHGKRKPGVSSPKTLVTTTFGGVSAGNRLKPFLLAGQNRRPPPAPTSDAAPGPRNGGQ